MKWGPPRQWSDEEESEHRTREGSQPADKLAAIDGNSPTTKNMRRGAAETAEGKNHGVGQRRSRILCGRLRGVYLNRS